MEDMPSDLEKLFKARTFGIEVSTVEVSIYLQNVERELRENDLSRIDVLVKKMINACLFSHNEFELIIEFLEVFDAIRELHDFSVGHDQKTWVRPFLYRIGTLFQKVRSDPNPYF